MKAALPQTGVLPSKLTAPGRTRISMKTKPPPSDKNRLAPPVKVLISSYCLTLYINALAVFPHV